MNQERDTFVDEGVDLREIFLVLLRKWWVVVAVIVVSVAAAWGYSRIMPDVYEARTQLLLVSRTSAGLTNPGTTLPNVSSALSADTLSNLALANDLLDDIVQAVSRDYPGSGNPASAEALAQMMKVDIQASAQNKTVVLPLLILTVRGEDPVLLERIAETWADLFIQRNASLFASESARSFDYIQTQYDETRKTLEAKNQERLAYLEKNPIRPLRSELITLAGTEPQVASTELKATASGVLVVDTTTRTGLFGSFLADLEKKQMALVAATAEEKRLIEALKAEPPELQQGINPVYIYLKEKLADASTQVASLTAEVNHLQGKTQDLRKSINDLSGQVLKIEVTESFFDREVAVLTSNLQTLAAKLQEARLAKEEEGGTIRVVESPIVPQAPTGPDRQRAVYLGAALGLLLGVVVALLLHYLLEPPVPLPGPQRRGPASPAS